MTKVLTIRLTPDLLGKAEARAARMGLDRAKYVRSLIEEDLATGKPHTTRRFASEDLAGMYVGSGQATSPPTAAMVAKPSRASFRRPDIGRQGDWLAKLRFP